MNLIKISFFLLISGFVLFLYGFLSRILDIYFFWESKSIGWFFILIGLILILANRIKIKNSKKEKSLIEKIGIGLITFILLVQTMIFIIIPNTGAYPLAIEFLKNDEKLKNEIGNIVSITHKPNGTVSKTSDDSGVHGEAMINLIVKGEKKFLDVTVYVSKSIENEHWKIDKLEY